MKRLRGIGVQLVIFFVIAISIPTFMLAIDVVVTTKSTQRSNMQLTSEQTLQETKKGFETYLKTLSQPIDLLTRKNEVKHLEDQGTIDDNVKAIQDSLVHQLRLQAVQREHSLQQRLDIRLQAGLSQILQMVRQLIRKQL